MGLLFLRFFRIKRSLFRTSFQLLRRRLGKSPGCKPKLFMANVLVMSITWGKVVLYAKLKGSQCKEFKL